jgi:hypothetical protein
VITGARFDHLHTVCGAKLKGSGIKAAHAALYGKLATIACTAGPTPNVTATMSGKLNVAEIRGTVLLVITDGPQVCTIKTTVQPPS